ncbi:hypothetical protein JCM11251_000241 [Rhodosporidiobolus azoricus]
MASGLGASSSQKGAADGGKKRIKTEPGEMDGEALKRVKKEAGERVEAEKRKRKRLGQKPQVIDLCDSD